MTEKRNESDSNSAVDVDAVEARLASLLDFSYEVHLCFLLHFALIRPCTPHPWHMTCLFQSLPFLSLSFLWLHFQFHPRPVFITNNSVSGARPRTVRRRASKDRRWLMMLATMCVFSEISSVDANVRHSSVFGSVDMLDNVLQESSIVMSHTARSLIIVS